jgi:cytochrome c peroxidase
MRVFVIFITGCLLVICCYSIVEYKTDHAPVVDNTRKWYRSAVDKLDTKVNILCSVLAQHQSDEKVQQAFKEARLAYKHIELVVEYYHPYTAQFINSPAIQQKGFQELEVLLFPSVLPTAAMEAKKLKSLMVKLQDESEALQPTDAQLFDAMRLELVRIMSLGISGFDSREAQNSLPEAVASLDGINVIWKLYAPAVNMYNPAVVKYMDELMTESKASLQSNDFDKQRFITAYMNNLAVNLKMAREALSIPYDNQQYILDPAASNIFAKNAILPLYSFPDSIELKDKCDTLYDINGQHFTASYLNDLLRHNSALISYANK